jgi:acyl carrier protein
MEHLAEIEKEIWRICSEIIGCNLNEFSKMRLFEIDGWDSLAHLEIILVLEEHLGVMMNNEVMEMTWTAEELVAIFLKAVKQGLE